MTLLPLLAWLSPSYPVGAYAYSHGLEWAAEAGDSVMRHRLAAWLADILQHGAGRTDAILLAIAHRAAMAADRSRLPRSTISRSRSRRRRNCASRLASRAAASSTRRSPPGRRRGLSDLAAALDDEVAYPVAVGVAAASHGLPLLPTSEAFLLAFVQNLVSAALRLAPIGQTAGTRVLAGLAPAVAALAGETLALGPDDLGGATFRADLGSFLHETQYTRLFRS